MECIVVEKCAEYIVEKAVEYLVNPTVRQGQYLFCIKKFNKNLEERKTKLTSKRDSILQRAEKAKKRTEIIEKPVEKWMDDVKNLLAEAENLKEEVEASNNCFHGYCPSRKRYRLCKQIAKKMEEMTELINRNEFETFSRLAPLPGIEYESSENFSFFNSTKEACYQLLEALRDDNAYIIGLYGMPGAGKTSLSLEVGKKAKEMQLFDCVINVTVSQTPNIEKIIAKMVDFVRTEFEERFEIKESTVDGIKQRLSMKLKREKVLIIVDDVWGKFNLKDIGVDLDPSKKGMCKILLTTRSQRVCALMGCQREFMLDLLTEEEAWTLFRKCAGIDDHYSSKILKVAWEVTRECKGLPISIKVVASSLKGILDVDEWTVALKKLKDSEPLDEEGERVLFSIKLSYDILKNEAKLLFLMCAMFPEDHEIPVEELIRYGAGLGVNGEFESLDYARKRVKLDKNKLLGSCLLMHSGDGDDVVKMHDTVRDTALWISKGEDRIILVNNETDLSSFVGNGAAKNCFAKILIINARSSRGLSCASFEGMKGLQVMAIINDSGYILPLSLPESIQSLTNLRTLRLRAWSLDDISLIVSLTKLEVLDLQSCPFNEVPEGIEKLYKLKLLDLTGSAVLQSYNSKAIASCPRLEELYVRGTGSCPTPQCFVQDLACKNLRRYELELGPKSVWLSQKYVSSLRIIKIKDFDVSAIVGSKNLFLQKAEEVEIDGLHGGWKNIITDMVQVVGAVNELRRLALSDCRQVECLTDADSFQEDALLPSPVNLKFNNLPKLKELCRGRPVLGFFKKLEKLNVFECRNLSNIFPREGKLCNLKVLSLERCGVVTVFSMSVARSLQQLKELSVRFCENLRHIIASEGDEISPALCSSNSIFPNLKKVDVLRCPKLQSVFPISCGQQGLVQLQEIDIRGCDELKYVFGPYDHENNNSSHDQNEIQLMLPSLQVFALCRLQNLIGMCQQNWLPSCPSLKRIFWWGCPRFTASLICSEQHPDVDGIILWEINTSSNQPSQQQMLPATLQSLLNIESIYLGFDCRVEGILKIKVEGVLHVAQNSLHSNLRSLKLEDLPELGFIWSGPVSFLGFHKLEQVCLGSCPKLKTIFPSDVVGSLQNLKYLRISNCEELEEIITSSDLNVVCFPRLKLFEVKKCDNIKCLFSGSVGCDFSRLSTLDIEECNKLKCLFSGSTICNLPNLSVLRIQECLELERVFHLKPTEVGDDEDRDHREQQPVLPKLRTLQLQNLPKFAERKKLEMQVKNYEIERLEMLQMLEMQEQDYEIENLELQEQDYESTYEEYSTESN